VRIDKKQKNLYIVDNPVKKYNNLRVEQDTLLKQNLHIMTQGLITENIHS
jgi:hypothetical protein